MGRALLAEPDLINRIKDDGDAHSVSLGVHALQQVHGDDLQPHPLRGHGLSGLTGSSICSAPTDSSESSTTSSVAVTV